MSTTKIEWATHVWNPVTGCTPISEGCANCYARRMASRLRGRCGYDKHNPFRLTVHVDRFNRPSHWRKPRVIFVCSMGDLFHEDVPFYQLMRIWWVMEQTPQHTYIILTKRPRRMLRFVQRKFGRVLPNVWLGVSAETARRADERIPILLKTPAARRIVSCEPLLGLLDLRPYLKGEPRLDWVICGAETGPRARPMNPDWARSLRDQCVEAGIPFFLKQLGPDRKRGLDGRLWEEIPEITPPTSPE